LSRGDSFRQDKKGIVNTTSNWSLRLRFHNHTLKKRAIRLGFHQQAADELGGDDLGGAGEEGLGQVLGGRGGYGSK